MENAFLSKKKISLKIQPNSSQGFRLRWSGGLAKWVCPKAYGTPNMALVFLLAFPLNTTQKRDSKFAQLALACVGVNWGLFGNKTISLTPGTDFAKMEEKDSYARMMFLFRDGEKHGLNPKVFWDMLAVLKQTKNLVSCSYAPLPSEDWWPSPDILQLQVSWTPHWLFKSWSHLLSGSWT